MATGVHVWSATAASNGSADSAINFQEGQAPSTVNDAGRGVMAKIAEYAKDTSGSLTTAGTSTAYTLAPNATFATLSELDGQCLVFKAHTTSGASPTLNVNSLGAKAIHSVGGTALPTAAFAANGVYAVVYDNSNSRFVLLGGFTTLSITTLAVSGDATVSGAVSGATAAGAMVATQANMETGTATDLLVTPGRQHHHLGHPKVFVTFAVPTTISEQFPAGANTVGNPSTGVYTLTVSTAFTNATYGVHFTPYHSSSAVSVQVVNRTTTVVTINIRNPATGALMQLDTGGCWTLYGDQ